MEVGSAIVDPITDPAAPADPNNPRWLNSANPPSDTFGVYDFPNYHWLLQGGGFADGDAFAAAYCALIGGVQPTPLSAMAYDAAMAEITAIQAVVSQVGPNGQVDRASVRQAVANVRFTGLTGNSKIQVQLAGTVDSSVPPPEVHGDISFVSSQNSASDPDRGPGDNAGNQELFGVWEVGTSTPPDRIPSPCMPTGLSTSGYQWVAAGNITADAS
jgi:hypothetical protein